MLQQTQVERVKAFYGPFLRRYPTVDALASARPAEVREAWDGLGYYARARNLHAAARRIVRDHGGELPADPEAVAALPGVGPYTAGAVLSFAFDREAPALDTNIRRVLTRVFVRRRSPRPAQMDRRLWALAEAVIPAGKAWAFNQALMDLGATICTARAPRCPACVLRDVCAAYPRLARGKGSPRRSQRSPRGLVRDPVGRPGNVVVAGLSCDSAVSARSAVRGLSFEVGCDALPAHRPRLP
jgi:A/G-specific adenine glycosylase